MIGVIVPAASCGDSSGVVLSPSPVRNMPSVPTTMPSPPSTTETIPLPPPVTQPPVTATTLQSAHDWALTHAAQVAVLASFGDATDRALKSLVNNFQSSDVIALNDACTALGGAVLDAVNWDIPPGTARDNLLSVIATNTQYVHDCMSVINSSDEAALGDSLQAIADDVGPSQDAWGAFTQSIS